MITLLFVLAFASGGFLLRLLLMPLLVLYNILFKYNDF